jgi:protein O-mannosyl-transferase
MRRGWFFAVLLVAATLLAYRPAWHGEKLWDDTAHLTQPELRSVGGLARIWTEVGATQQYYPLTFSAFWMQDKLWGERTLGYHVVNVLLHVLAALLFLAILRRLEVPGAYLAAAIFALHPICAESVAWMSQLKNTLSGVLYLGAALAYFCFDTNRRRGLYALALVLFLLGLLSKTAVLSLPAAILVVLWWRRGSLSWKRDLLPLVPFFVAGIAAGLLTVHLEQNLYGAKGEEFQFTAVERGLLAGRALWFHLSLLMWPANLLFMYPRWHIEVTAWWQYLYPAAAALLVAGLWALRQRSRGPLAALLLFAGTLFPTLGFFNVCTFRYSFVNDHHQYLACLGVIALFGAAATHAFRRWGPGFQWLGKALAVVLLTGLATLTWQQSRQYANAETLWRTTVAANPTCYLGWENLGNISFGRGQVDEAMADFQKALSIRPDYAEGHNDLGLALSRKGLPDEAIAHFQKAVELRPGLWEAYINLGNALAQRGQSEEAIAQYRFALRLQPANGKIHANLGQALLQQGRLHDAKASLQQALELLPNYAPAHDTLGLVLLQDGQMDEAIVQFSKAIELDPTSPESRRHLADAFLRAGNPGRAASEFSEALRAEPADAVLRCGLAAALGAQGRVPEAIEQYRAALRAQPDLPEALNNLAWILATAAEPSLRNGTEAVVLAERACELTQHKQPTMIGTLAAAYAETGQFARAVTTAEKAAALAQEANQFELVARNRKLAETYRAGQPARDAR